VVVALCLPFGFGMVCCVGVACSWSVVSAAVVGIIGLSVVYWLLVFDLFLCI